jgi:hypothetical protein
MKKSLVLLAVLAAPLLVTGQDLQMNFNDAAGNGWAPVSTTAHQVTFYKPTSVYYLTPSPAKINTSEIAGFKLTFTEQPKDVKIYINGLNEAGEAKMTFADIKLEGMTMNYTFRNFETVEKLGIRLNGEPANSETVVGIERFCLIDKDGNEITTLLPTAKEAQKQSADWKRHLSTSAAITYNGNYNRELEWAPSDLNDYNTLEVKFAEPLTSSYGIQVKRLKDKKEETGYKSAPIGAETFTVDLKKDYKDQGETITALLFVGKTKGDTVSIESITLKK